MSYMRGRWKYSQGSGLKTPLSRLVQDPNTHCWVDIDEVDPPRQIPRTLGPDRQLVYPMVPGEDVAAAGTGATTDDLDTLANINWSRSG